MATYPFLVQTAWNTLGELLRQWQREPFLWAREIHIQAELGGRLSQVLSLQGMGTLTGSYGHGLRHFDERQTWSRVGYQPNIPYRYGDKLLRCHPDVVIWDDVDELGKPPSPDYASGHTWPIAWACELKYGSADSGEWDAEKLKLLLADGRIKFGCAVNVHFSPSADGIHIEWERTSPNSRLWICNVRTPLALA